MQVVEHLGRQPLELAGLNVRSLPGVEKQTAQSAPSPQTKAVGKPVLLAEFTVVVGREL